MKFKITNKETSTRVGFILLGFFTLYLVQPIRDYADAHITTNPIMLGIGGIILTLYLFEF